MQLNTAETCTDSNGAVKVSTSEAIEHFIWKRSHKYIRACWLSCTTNNRNVIEQSSGLFQKIWTLPYLLAPTPILFSVVKKKNAIWHHLRCDASELTFLSTGGGKFQTPNKVNISMQFEIIPQTCLSKITAQQKISTQKSIKLCN